MRLGSLIILPIVCFALAPSIAHAQDEADDAAPAPVVSASSNAATFYRRAFAKYHEVDDRITEEHWEAVYDFERDPSRGPSMEVREILNRLQPIITLTKQAARRENSDFNIDYAADENNLQHLSDARSLVLVLSHDYQAQVVAGESRAAVEDLTTMFRMAGQVAQERVLIGSMVGNAMFAFADNYLDMALDHALIGPSEANVLLKELAKFDSDDPLRFRESLAGEGKLIAESITKRFAGEEGVERFRAEFANWGPEDEATTAMLDSLTLEKLQVAMAWFATAAESMAEALADPDSERSDQAIARIARNIERQEFAALARSIPAVRGDLLRDSLQRSKKQLNDRRQLLTDIAEGRLNPMALANAAVWYIRATLQFEQIDPDKRRLIDAYAAKHDAPADAQLVEILNRHDVQTLLETLRIAVSLNQCDFSYAAGHWPYTFRPYHAGLLGCGRMLVADAARLLHEQRYDEATLQMGTAYRMSADIASDGFIAGSLAAHRIFSDADALVDAAIDSRMLSSDHIALLAENVKELSRVDPFHYQAAGTQMLQTLDYPITYMVQGLPADLAPFTKETSDRAAEILASLEPDRVLSLLSVYERWEPDYYSRIPNAAPQPKGDLNVMCAGLETIFDVQAIRDAGALVPLFTDWARSGGVGTMEQVQTFEFPLIAPIQQRAKESLNDYRRCVLRLDRLLPDERSITGRGGVENSAPDVEN